MYTQNLWTLDFFHEKNIFLNSDQLQKIVQSSHQLEEYMEIERLYSVHKTIGGVKIEVGELILLPTTLEKITELFSSLVRYDPKKDQYEALQDIGILTQWAQENDLEIPNPQYCEGYRDNNEMVVFYQHNNLAYILQFKYKPNKLSGFILYKLSFCHTSQGFFILRQKDF